ncbi:hypothetical protein EXIGLDRAFT_728657 [Exidia glandulosa HHB12029]|uniref:Uncharacterized protein n=1 Tax=Exidia glandulosa HHB12029 TaxID=1314781 RepID=A0A165LQT4_EXIGL|nr:hypothetical protein EXIGLDRAFT_728657 [Exidia glandulosa HHB12029]
MPKSDTTPTAFGLAGRFYALCCGLACPPPWPTRIFRRDWTSRTPCRSREPTVSSSTMTGLAFAHDIERALQFDSLYITPTRTPPALEMIVECATSRSIVTPCVQNPAGLYTRNTHRIISLRKMPSAPSCARPLEFR